MDRQQGAGTPGDAFTSSNARPLAIFAGYLVIAAVLAAASMAPLVTGRGGSATGGPSAARRRRRAVFAGLAALSLATTWLHMLRFFGWSFGAWAAARGGSDAELRLGDWLRDTALFRQAWAATLETPARAWWALQIFGFCASWSVALAVQGTRRGIPRVWILMLLGQVVAISFAMNLSFLAFLASPPPKDDAGKHRRPASAAIPAYSQLPWHHLVLGLSIGLALAVPGSFGRPHFMWLLLAPHVLAFAPLLLGALQPAEPSWRVKAAAQAVILAAATAAVARQGGGLAAIPEALYEHPAVSSVGWDVICCWLSSAAWYALGD